MNQTEKTQTKPKGENPKRANPNPILLGVEGGQ